MKGPGRLVSSRERGTRTAPHSGLRAAGAENIADTFAASAPRMWSSAPSPHLPACAQRGIGGGTRNTVVPRAHVLGACVRRETRFRGCELGRRLFLRNRVPLVVRPVFTRSFARPHTPQDLHFGAVYARPSDGACVRSSSAARAALQARDVAGAGRGRVLAVHVVLRQPPHPIQRTLREETHRTDSFGCGPPVSIIDNRPPPPTPPCRVPAVRCMHAMTLSAVCRSPARSTHPSRIPREPT
ncbi:hypothetical protein B0H17DRAFT_639362 [Mycena rosella]|uniref:Uncharacterized protein n=1 Tax=Mycena rosella TaxID=1033263 RepID=A0AAD7BER2_MYCRO|nr:hypothetical protein B0H17DRAFT_639362 [Mycena rosella]